MFPFAWILLLAATTRVELVDEVYQIPAGEWRFIQFDLEQRPATVSASYEVRAGAPQVKLALLRREELERLNGDLPHEEMAATRPGSSGHFDFDIRPPGKYVILLDNRGAGGSAAAVHLEVWLDFARVTEVSPQRQLTVILISFAVFFGVVTFSARRMWRAMRTPPPAA